MRISRIQLQNFRNFHAADFYLSDHAVFVGENKIGKTNLLYALRLILDPTLPESARQLKNEDFWDGLKRPLKKDDRIIISIELTDFEGDENLFAILADYIVDKNPIRSKLTFVFQPIEGLTGGPKKDADYEFFFFGGKNAEKHISGYEFRSRIPIDVLPALRDTEDSLSNWKKSPLRYLLEEAASKIDQDKLEKISKKISKTTLAVAKIDEIKNLETTISSKLEDIIGKSNTFDMSFGFSPTVPNRLLKALRLFIDSGKRNLNEASLGSSNLLYLTLKSLEALELSEQGNRDHTFLGIEEPEAHLHPHLQRLIYREFLNPKDHLPSTGQGKEKTTILLTTHSPHIVSVSPLKSLILLKKNLDERSTEVISTANLDLNQNDIADLERYIDVTRGEILFSKGILLVEGDAEMFLLPALGRAIGYDFDELGITVCSVSGVNFLPYIKLIGESGLKIPFAVITDFDPHDGGSFGQDRVIKLLSTIQPNASALSKPDKLKLAKKNGLFINKYTFEVDLFKSGHHKEICKTIIELTESDAIKERAREFGRSPGSLDAKQFLNDIKTIGKGRLAQRLAANLVEKDCPVYIKRAIKHVVKQQ